jgi:hypothetical protein
MVCVKLLAAGFSLKRLGNYDRQIARSVVSMKTAWSGLPLSNGPLALSEESRDLVSKKAGDVIVHFAPHVKLQFDDIFVSTLGE